MAFRQHLGFRRRRHGPRGLRRRRTASLALVLASLAVGPAAAAGGAGSVRGQVAVLRRQALSGLRPASDRGGAVVYVSGFTDPAPRIAATLNQRREQFHPRVLPIVAGQTVVFPNHDRIYHNVFSVSPVQPFDLGQYRSVDAPRDVVFERPGLVPVYCNIHPQMLSYVVVLENTAFAVTGEDGSFAIDGIPPGDHVLNAWIPGAQRVSQPLRVEPGGGEQVVALELRQTERIKPHKRKDGSDYPKPGSE